MTRVKICGLMNVEAVVAAAEAGADFLGFVFVPNVRRRLSVEKVKEIIGSYRGKQGTRGPKLVGLFANQPPDEVNKIAESCELDLVHLTGEEPPEYWERIKKPIIKALHVRDDQPISEVVAPLKKQLDILNAQGHLAMLDRYDKGSPGGTGHIFNWAIAQALSRDYKFLLGGGLTPDNVAQAIRIVAPFGVDVSSGVETDGVKEIGKIRAFIGQARAADLKMEAKK